MRLSSAGMKFKDNLFFWKWAAFFDLHVFTFMWQRQERSLSWWKAQFIHCTNSRIHPTAKWTKMWTRHITSLSLKPRYHVWFWRQHLTAWNTERNKSFKGSIRCPLLLQVSPDSVASNEHEFCSSICDFSMALARVAQRWGVTPRLGVESSETHSLTSLLFIAGCWLGP